MKGDWIAALLSCGLLLLSGCSAKAAPVKQQTESRGTEKFTRESRIEDVQNDPAFGGFDWMPCALPASPRSFTAIPV